MLSKQKSQKKHTNYLLYILLFVTIGYAVFLIVTTQTEIAKKETEYEIIHSKLTQVLEENRLLEHYVADQNLFEYMEDIARDKLEYANPRERIYYVIPG